MCDRCGELALWRSDRLVNPDTSTAPSPNSDLPADISADYEEARSILSRSPRGAAALLRLCIQKLCVHLKEPGKHLDTDIAALVKKGLPPGVQRSLDAVRVIGNNAVHPGKIDLKDNQPIATALFRLVNLIAEKMISDPKEIDAIYDIVPESAREAIEKRDNGS